MSLFSYFTDPVLRAPMIGCIFMALASSLIGTLVMLRRQSLMGEVISHAAFPGVVLGVLLAAPFFSESSEGFSAVLLSMAFGFSLLGIFSIRYLEKRRISSDSALCFILATFFGLGVLLASRIQVLQTAWYKQALVFLFGQAATMTDHYLPLYVALGLVAVIATFLLYPTMQALLFDPNFAKVSGIKVKRVDLCFTLLVAIAIVIGMRSIGVVLMAGMLIAPGIAARPWCKRLSSCLLLAAFFAISSALLGNVLSVEGTKALSARFPEWRFSLPTGPLILLLASSFCFLSLLLSPQGGLVRLVRRWAFRRKIRNENLLKVFWKRGKEATVSKQELFHSFPGCTLSLLSSRLRGWIVKAGTQAYVLSPEGWARASRIVRLHRLWEVYLVQYMGQGADRVHKSAEEFEHLSDESVEEELENLLGNLERDPHAQPIPKKEEGRW